MNFYKMFFRDKTQTSVKTIQTWEVRWISRHGYYSSDTKEEVRVFVTRKEADIFAFALEDAFKLIKHTSGTRVNVIKTKE